MAIQPLTFSASPTTPSNQPGTSSVGGIHPITFGNPGQTSKPTSTPAPASVSAPKTVATPQVGKPLNFIQQAEQTASNVANTVIKGITLALTPPKNPTPLNTPAPQSNPAVTTPKIVATPKVGQALQPSFQQPAQNPSATLNTRKSKVNPNNPINKSVQLITQAISSNMPETSKLVAQLGSKPDITKSLNDAWTAYSGSIMNEAQALRNYIDTYANPKSSEASRIGTKLEVIAGGAGVIFAPISALFSGAADVPVLAPTVRMINIAFSALGEGATAVSNKIVDTLPISSQAKAQIKPGLGQIFALAAQIGIGGKLGIDIKDKLVENYGITDAQTIVEQAKQFSLQENKDLIQRVVNGQGTPAEIAKYQILAKAGLVKEYTQTGHGGYLPSGLSATDETLSTAQTGVGQKATSVADSLTPGEHTPNDVINAVFQAKAEDTPEGKAVLQTASEAQRQGQNIMINKTDKFIAPKGDHLGFDYLNSNADKLIEQANANPGLRNADNNKDLFKPIGYNGKNSALYHEASSSLTDHQVAQDIANLKPGDHYVFTAGMSGAGKSTGSEGENLIGLDGNFSSNHSVERVGKILDKGAYPTIEYTVANPVDAWDRLIKRAVNPKNGRVVPLQIAADNLVRSLDNVKKVVKTYGTKANVKIIDNTRGKGEQSRVANPLDYLSKLSYNKADETKQFVNKTVERIQDGTIKDEETAKAISGSYWGQISKQLEEKNASGSNGSKLRTASLESTISEEGKQITKEIVDMIYSGDEDLAKGLYDAYTQDGNYLPPFDEIKNQANQIREFQTEQLASIEKELQAEQQVNRNNNPDDPTNQMIEIAGMMKKHFSAPGAKWKITGKERVYTSVEGYSMKVGGTYTEAVDRLFDATDIEGFKKNVKILADKFDKSFTEIYDRIRSGAIDGADYEQFKERLNQEVSHNQNVLKNSIDAKSKADLVKSSNSENRESIQSSTEQGLTTGNEVGNVNAGNVENPNAIANSEPGSRAVGAEGSNAASSSEYILSDNLKITDAYPKDFLGYNIPELQNKANEIGFNLYDALIKRVDSQNNMPDKLKGMDSILDDLYRNPLPSPTEEALPSQAQKEPVSDGGGVVEDKFMPEPGSNQFTLEATKGTELENMPREIDWTGQEGFINVGAIDGGEIIKDIKSTLEKAKANQEDKDFGTALRTYFVGERDVRIAETNQLILTAEKLVKLPVQQEALTFMRDFKSRPGDLPMIIDGTHPYYDAAVERFKKENPDATQKEIEDFAQKILDRGAKLKKMIEQAANPTEGMKKVDNAMNLYFKGRLEEGKKLGFLDSKVTPEEYIPHLFVPPAEAVDVKPGDKGMYAKKNKIARYFKFAKGRAYKDVVEAYLNGVDPRTLNAFDSMAIYGDQHATVAATKLLIQQLKDTELGKWGSRKSEFIPSDWKPIAPESSLFQNEIPFVTQVNKADLQGAELAKWEKMLKDGIAKEIGDQYVKADVAHQSLFAPEKVVKALMPITDGDYMNKLPLFGKSRLYQAYIKSAELSLSIFHMRAMEITAGSNMGAVGFMKAQIADMYSPKFLDGEKIFIRAGGTSSILGRTIEAYSATRKTTVKSRIPTRKDLMMMTPGLKQMNGFAHFLTYETFNVLQRKLKVTDFMTKDAGWIAKHPNATDAEHYAFQKSIAKEINAAYGGLQWEIMGVNKMTQSVLKLLLLAPDWTFSNWFNAKTAFQGGAAGAAARSFWVRAIIIGLVLNQLWSLLMSGQLSDDPTKAYLGKDSAGKKIYTNIGFAGAPEDVINLIKNINDYGIEAGIFKSIAAKEAPLIRTGTELLTNRNYLGQAIVPKGSGVLVGTARSAYELAAGLSPIPFSIQNWFTMLTDPNGKYIPAEYISILLGGGTASHVIPQGQRQVTSGVNKGKLVPASPNAPQRPFWEQVTTGKIYQPKRGAGSSGGTPVFNNSPTFK